MLTGNGGTAIGRRSIPLLAGWFTVAIGIVVLSGWFLQIPSLVKPSWSVKGMAFNTAVSFVFAGTACILTVLGPGIARRWVAALAALLPLATILASVFGYDASIASGLYLPNLAQASMAPFTALGLAAAATVFLLCDKGGQRGLIAEATLSGAAVTPLVLGMIPVASAGLGVFDLTPWGPHFAAMSMMTACGLIALGGACLNIVLARAGRAGDGASHLGRPIAAITAIALVSWALFDSVLTILQQREDRTNTIGQLIRVDDAADALGLSVARAELRREQAMPDRVPLEEAKREAAKVADDYKALSALVSGSHLEELVNGMRTELDAELALLQSGPATPSPVNERIAMDIGNLNREIAASIRAVSQNNPFTESVLRRNLIVSWLVCGGAIGIGLLALFLELRKRLAVEAILRADELKLQDRISRATQELRAEVTENREVHRRLSESELRFRSTFEQAAVGLAHISPQGRFIRVNEKLCRITGYSREELAEKSFADITHAGDMEADWENARALLRGEMATYSMERRCFHRDGPVIWVNLTRSLVRRPDGEPDYFIAVIEDITPRKTAELMLQSSERRFRWVVESCPVGIVETDRSGSVTRANRAFYSLVGWTPEDFAAEAMNMRRLTPDDWMERSDERISYCIEKGRPVVYEKEYFKRNGSRIPVLVGLSFQGESAGEAVTFVVDMSELKRTEQLLRSSEERFRLVVEASPSAMIMVDTEGCIHLVNAQTEKLFGYRREEMIGSPVEMLIPERFRPHHPGHRAAFLTEQRARPMGAGRDLFGVRRDGSEVPIEIGLNPVATPEGRFVLATVVDISARMAADAAIRESARQLAQLADAMPQMVWTSYPDGSPEFRNRRWHEFLQVPEGISDLEMNQFVHPDDFERMLAGWRTALDSGLPYDSQARFQDRRNGIWRWHLNRALPIHDADGRLVKWVGTSTDIHDHKILSEELEGRVELRTADLKRSLLEKELLLKEVHHRVKNNLQIICSLLSMQAEQAGNSATTGSTASVIESIREAHHRVLSMAMIHEHLYQSDTLEDIDFGQYAESLAIRLFQAYCADTSRIGLELSIEPIHLTIDQAIPCGLILNELISNALKHAFNDDPGGAIRIVFRRIGPDRAELSVGDTGAGLPAGFDIMSVRSLGLQVVQALSEQLGASLQITTEVGTRIALDLPLLSAGSVPGKAEIRSDKPPPHGGGSSNGL